MSVTAIVGANWGDEGKGKITDVLAAEADYVVRFQGGDNAGHTVITEAGKFALHLLPAGVLQPHTTNVLGPGVALNVRSFYDELQGLAARGIATPTLRVAQRAQVVLPLHLARDVNEEERLGRAGFGSTRRGIAPLYADKFAKRGIQAYELLDAARLHERLAPMLESENVLLTQLYGQAPLELEPLVDELAEQGRLIEPYLCDTTSLLQGAVANGASVLLEGQLGALRDPDHGIYPYSTSSSPLAGNAAVGAGIAPYHIKRIVAVVKAYSSCVGAGPFVCEVTGAAGDELRARGGADGEYGATTGRPRRVGWFDAVATRYGCRVQGATEAALSLLDVLGYRDEILICTAYEIDGEQTTDFPLTAAQGHARPVWRKLPGWRCDISGARRLADLPAAARAYVAFIEEQVGVPIRMISVGPERGAVIGV